MARVDGQRLVGEISSISLTYQQFFHQKRTHRQTDKILQISHANVKYLLLSNYNTNYRTQQLITRWYRTGTVLVPYWCRAGTVLVAYWYRTGTILVLVPYWYRNGTVMVPYKTQEKRNFAATKAVFSTKAKVRTIKHTEVHKPTGESTERTPREIFPRPCTLFVVCANTPILRTSIALEKIGSEIQPTGCGMSAVASIVSIIVSIACYQYMVSIVGDFYHNQATHAAL